MNRSDLRWALDSVIPHAGDSVVLESSPASTQLYVWATDRYSAGVATIPHESKVPFICAIPLRVEYIDKDGKTKTRNEARDLSGFVNPSRKAQEVESVDILLQNDELHVAHATDSAVFDCISEQPKSISEVLLPLFQGIWKMPHEEGEFTYRPSLFARFAKAQRTDLDRLYIHPRSSRMAHLAIVTVGENFIGAIMGLTYGDPQAKPATLELVTDAS